MTVLCISFYSDNTLLPNPADARRILRQGHLPLEGAVAKMEAEEAVCGAESEPAKSRATVGTSSDYILEIRGFKPGTPSDMVEMFIENQSGESELRSFEYDEEKCVAVVAFNHAQGKMFLYCTISVGPLRAPYSWCWNEHVCQGKKSLKRF